MGIEHLKSHAKKYAPLALGALIALKSFLPSYASDGLQKAKETTEVREIEKTNEEARRDKLSKEIAKLIVEYQELKKEQPKNAWVDLFFLHGREGKGQLEFSKKFGKICVKYLKSPKNT